MLDAITALGLTASVVQVVDSTCRFVSKCQRIYDAGSAVENVELESITTDLEIVNSGLIESFRAAVADEDAAEEVELEVRPHRAWSLEADDKALLKLAEKCQALAAQLLQKLRRLRVDCQNRRWRSFCQALKNAWAREEVSDISERIHQFRDQLQFHLLASIQSRITFERACQDQRYKQLNLKSQETIQLILTNRDLFHVDQDIQTEKLYRRHDWSDRLALQRDEEARRRYQYAEGDASHRHAENRRWHIEHEILADRRHEDILRAINRKSSKDGAREAQERVLSLLRFDKMTDRQDEVADKHRETFEWVFSRNSSQDQPWSDLNTWLEQDNGCYWLSGKAGSGKSTFMKFLSEDSRTLAALKRWAPRTRSLLGLEPWAPPHGYVTASFFFWHAGTYMQNSQKGLVQKLLHDILEQCPEIISVVLPDIYERARKSEYLFGTQISFCQLKKAFKNLIEYCGSQFGICLFVDGLDEYISDQGTHTELAEFFFSICRSSKIKAVLSSRPLPAFEEVFGGCPMLRLQDLTKHDIDFYVHDRLTNNTCVAYMMDDSPRAIEELIDEIVSKAAGVFLWVKLAVNAMLDGLQSYDDFEHLQQRLLELPEEIDDLYMHMLRRIPPRYRLEASKMLQLVTTSQLLSVNKTLTALDISFATDANPYLANEAKLGSIREGELIARAQIAEGRLKSRCGGFVEVHHKLQAPEDGSNESQLILHLSLGDNAARGLGHSTSSNLYRSKSKNAEVQFLHKTAADFLCQPDVQSYLLGLTAGRRFDPTKNLLRSCVLQAKTLPCEDILGIPVSDIGKAITSGLRYAQILEERTGRLQMGLLDELARVVSAHRRSMRLSRIFDGAEFSYSSSEYPGKLTSFDSFEPFAGMAIRYGHFHYLQEKLRAESMASLESGYRPLLFSALRVNPILENSECSQPAPEFVELLLRHGAEPNEIWGGMTPWVYACMNYHDLDPDGGTYNRRSYASIISLLIAAGAEPNVTFERIDSSTTESYEKFSPISAIKLLPGEQVLSSSERTEFPIEQNLLRLLEERGGECTYTPWMLHMDSWKTTSANTSCWTESVVRNSAWPDLRLCSEKTYQFEH